MRKFGGGWLAICGGICYTGTGTERSGMTEYGKQVNKCLIRIQKGDNEGLAELFELTANHLRMVARLYLDDKSLCDDVVMETFLRVMKYNGAFNTIRDGYGWLCGIARNEALTCKNREKKYAAWESAERMESKKDEWGEADVQLTVFFATEKLGERDREIAQLRYCYDYTLQEIARITGMSKTAVYKRLAKIKKNFEKVF